MGIALLALGACRLDISPEEFDLTADVGDTVQETLTLSNPGDDPVDYTLTPAGAGIALSSESGRVEAGEQTEVEVSMTCDEAGRVSGSIRVRAATGNKSSIVEVPVALQCGPVRSLLDVTPNSLDLAIEFAENIQELLLMANPGDDTVDVTMTPVGGGITLSHRTDRLEPGDSAWVGVFITCHDAGEVAWAVRFQASAGNGSSTVEVPIVLHCGAIQHVEPPELQGGAGLVSIEIFQGPPVYKADFDTGRTYGPVPMSKPEDGSPARTPILWTQDELSRSHIAWSPGYEGFVTAVWRKRATVAVAVWHPDDTRVPDVTAAIGMDGARTDLPEIYQETHRTDEGYITDIVFDVERTLFARGAALHVSVDSGDEQVSERVVFVWRGGPHVFGDLDPGRHG